MQVVGRYRDEFGVLQLAHALGEANPLAARKPPLVTTPAGRDARPAALRAPPA
jgi:hypothetical protein